MVWRRLRKPLLRCVPPASVVRETLCPTTLWYTRHPHGHVAMMGECHRSASKVAPSPKATAMFVEACSGVWEFWEWLLVIMVHHSRRQCCCWLQVADLQTALKEEQIIVEEKKAQTDELIVSIGKEKAVVDEAVEAGREDEEAASKLAEEVLAFQEECTKDLAAGVPLH